MKLEYAFAIALHRVFDSSAPDKQAVFWMGGHRLQPYRKPDGLYVFVDTPPEELTVECTGYQTERILPSPQKLTHLRLYPAPSCIPPAGWSLWLERAPPNQVCFLPDDSYSVRVLEVFPQLQAVNLRARPGFLGGCLRLGQSESLALVIGRQPPDLYYLDCMDSMFDSAVKGYAARADGDGCCPLVIPNGFPINKRKEDGLWG